MWFFGLPIIVYAVMALLQLTYLTSEPIKFVLTSGNEQDATAEIMKFYAYATDVDRAKEVQRLLARSCQKTTSKITIAEAFCSRRYRNGTYVALGVMAIHELAAANAIMLQTNDIISQMKGFALTPREGTIFIGVWNFFAASCSLYSGKAFSRRFLLAGGHTLIGVFLILFGLLNQMGKPTYAFAAMLAYLFVL